MRPIILLGPTAQHFNNISKGAEIANVLVDHFPGGESYCQIQENIRGQDVFIIQSISSPANDSLMDLLVMADAARRASAGRLTAVVPYMGYMRQDRKDKPRVPISAKLVIDLLETAGFNRIMTIDVHTLQAQGFTNIPFDHLFGFPLIAEALKKLRDEQKDLHNHVFVSPDIGAVKKAQTYAEIFKADFAIVNKKRLNYSNVKADSLIGDVKGKPVIIVDDLTESCGTLVAAAEICKKNGATEIIAAVTHPCLHEKGKENLEQALNNNLFTYFVTTNTVATFGKTSDRIVVQDASQLLNKAILCTNRDESISGLFKVKGY